MSMFAHSILENLKRGVEPGWRVRYQVGLLLNRELDPVGTLDEVAAELGISTSNAYTETLLALGTFACLLSVCLRLPPDQRQQYLAQRPRHEMRLSGSPRQGRSPSAAADVAPANLGSTAAPRIRSSAAHAG